MTILSIQSHVTYGHVGNSAAVFPLQRAGHEVWPVHTVNFSNHTGYGDWGGPMIPASDVTSIIDGIEKRGAFPQIDAILSGYQGGADIAVVDAEAADTRSADDRRGAVDGAVEHDRDVDHHLGMDGARPAPSGVDAGQCLGEQHLLVACGHDDVQGADHRDAS